MLWNNKQLIANWFAIGILIICIYPTKANGIKDSIDHTTKLNPIPSLHYIQSNAFGLKKGEGYIQNDMIFLNQAGYGITKNIMLQAGWLALSFIDKDASPFWLSSKWHIAFHEKHAFSISGTVIGFPGSSPWQGVLMGGYTYENPLGQVTFGAGYSIDNRGNRANLPILELAAHFPYTNKNVIFITENYFTPISNNKNIYSFLLGWRWIKKQIHWHFYLYGGNLPNPTIFDKNTLIFPVIGVVKPFK